MKYLIGTIVNYIVDQTKNESGIFRFILPSYPANMLFKIGTELEEKYLRQTDNNIAFKYGIAYNLGEKWKNSTNMEDKNYLLDIQNHGWYNKDNNLTNLRNMLKSPSDDKLVILLAGYDNIDDQASLQDFFHLDQDRIWTICLKESFLEWITNCIKEHANPDDSESDLEKINDVFCALYDHAIADLLDVSKYLETQVVSGDIYTVRDIYKLILSRLGSFNLPSMIGFSRNNTKKRIDYYIIPAQKFINYSMFIEQEKTIAHYKKNISEYRVNNINQLDKEILGNFDNRDDLLNALEDYIENYSINQKNKLLSADFVYIYDKILGFRTKSQERPKKPVKLSGFPPEIFLHAAWLSIWDMILKNRYYKSNNLDEASEIILHSIRFIHDFDSSDNDNDPLINSDDEMANLFLLKIIGGIDKYLENKIRLENSSLKQQIIFKSELSPSKNNSLIFKKSFTKEPRLNFSVEIKLTNGKSFRREFEWLLPQNHQCRLLVNLFSWIGDWFLNNRDSLPILFIPYFTEIFNSRDEDEINRIINNAINSKERKVMGAIDDSDPNVRSDKKQIEIEDLSINYQNFITEVNKSGFFSAIIDKYDDLRKSYHNTCQKYINNSRTNTLGPILLKSFLVISSNNYPNIDDIIWQKYIDSTVITPLHPSLLDMIRHQHTYLCESFCYYISRILEEPNIKKIENYKSVWNRITDHSKIKWPIFGILKDSNMTLDTNIRSYNYFHTLGQFNDESSFITSKLMLRYDDFEDEEITNQELFRESQASRLINHVLLDFRNLYPYAEDGITLAAYCGGKIQPIISGIDSYLNQIKESIPKNKEYSIKLIIFSDSNDDSVIDHWIDAWREIWQTAEITKSKQYYNSCRISICYRVVSNEENFKQLTNLLKNIKVDIMFFADFIKSASSRFESLGQKTEPSHDYRKFPILEKICCGLEGGGQDQKRERIISNHRFQLGYLHSEIMAHLKNGNLDQKEQHAVISQSDFFPWLGTIDEAHNCSAWVVCIDPSIDEYQLKWNKYNTREIIGFGTGVGAYGEDNFTISTEKFIMKDIKDKIRVEINRLIGPLNDDEQRSISECLIKKALNIAGLSIIKATGPDRYVRELIANSMVRKLLKKDDKYFYDDIISLDAFLHWFDYSSNKKRPDLLRIRARIIDEIFHLEVQIIECKLANKSDEFLDKAHEQLISGLEQLVPCFKPRIGKKPVGIEDRPDQRYWWMQLHRLIASKVHIKRSECSRSLLALERLSDGYFNISWQAGVIAFWTDDNSDKLDCQIKWNHQIDDQTIDISAACAGKKFIKKTCLEDLTENIFCGDQNYIYKCCIGIENTHIEISDNSADKIEGSFNDSIEPSISYKSYIKRDIAERILLGHETNGPRNIYWEFGHPNLENRHILVFGASGTGKTYTIQALLCELGQFEQNSLIVDYTDGFTSNQLEDLTKEKLKPLQHYIRKEPLFINPFRKQSQLIDDFELEEDPSITAQRVSGVFSEIYQLGDQQKSALYTAISDGIKQSPQDFNFDSLASILENIRDNRGPTGNSAATVLSKIRPFVDMNPFGKEDQESWEKIYNDHTSRCHIIQLSGFSRDAFRLITEFSLIDLYWFYRAKGKKDDPKVIVLDEIQNLDHRIDSPLGQFLTEGRKFGISLILATQTLSNLSRDQRDRLFQASHKLFFKPADTELRTYAQILSDTTNLKIEDWITRLSGLRRGECYSLGPIVNSANGKLEIGKYFKIKITALEERFGDY